MRTTAMLAPTLMLLVLRAGVAAEPVDGQLIRFVVSDADTAEVLYSGVEEVSVVDATVRKRTVYRGEGRGEVLVEEVSYDRRTLEVVAFRSEHREAGERVVLRRDGKRLLIEHVPRAGETPRRDDSLTWGPRTRLGKTLHEVIVRNWDELTARRAVSFDLLVPSKFDSFGFRIVEQPRSGEGHRVFRLEPQAWLLRQVVPPMDFHYDDARRAVQYVGPSTVDHDAEPNRRVVIRFY